MISIFITILILSYASFFVICNKIQIDTIKNKIKLFLILLLLALPGLLIPIYYLHLFDDHVWYYNYRSIPFVELALLLIVPLFAFICAWFPKLAIPNLILLTLLILLPFVKHLMHRLDPAQLTNKISNGVTLQSSASTCGPCALATILRKMNIEKSEVEIARECHTTKSGTEIWYINRYIKSLGIKTKFYVKENSLPIYPAIAGIKSSGFGHFISILDKKDGIYTIADPLYGIVSISENEVLKKIRFTGFYLQIIP